MSTASALRLSNVNHSESLEKWKSGPDAGPDHHLTRRSTPGRTGLCLQVRWVMPEWEFQRVSCLAAPLVGDVLPFLHPSSTRPTIQVDHKPTAVFANRCASQSHPQRALQGGNHHLITFLLAAWHLNREAAGKSEGYSCTHQIPYSGWMFSLSFFGSIIYNIESELIWFQSDYWSSAVQQCFLCCTLVRMWVSHVFLLQLSWWRPLPSPQILREDEQAAGGLQHVQQDLLPRPHGSQWHP